MLLYRVFCYTGRMKKVPLSELQSLAASVLNRLPSKKEGAVVVALQGDVGAGKTTFVQALARELGITATVQSPTYVLMKSYPISWGSFRNFIHIDAYRLNSKNEFSALKPETFLGDPRTLVCIEWPERVTGALPAPDVVLKFSSEGAGEEGRYITF